MHGVCVWLMQPRVEWHEDIRAYRIHVPTYYLHCELGMHDSREIATRGTKVVSVHTYTHFPE